MKKFLSVLLVCILSVALVKGEFNKEEMIKKLHEYANDCMAKEGASKSDIDDLIQKKPSASKEGKCMRACIMTKVKLMDANGILDKSVALEHSKIIAKGDSALEKTATEVIATCSAISVPEDRCEAAEQYGKCFKDESVARGVEIKI